MNPVIKKLGDKKILILGFAREGQSTYYFLRKYFPHSLLGLADQKDLSAWDSLARKIVKNDRNIKVIAGSNYLKVLNDYDFILKSPGVANKFPEIKASKKKGVIFSSQTKLFFKLCKGKIIGVTGTKGKSTTTTLIYKMLKKGGLKVILLGNIGKPPLDYLGKDFGEGKYFAFEMSSHQLADMDKSPSIAVVLNIFREHLDYYESFDDYVAAKVNITRFQSENDYFIFNNDFEILKQVLMNTRAKKLSFSLSSKTKSSCYMKGEYIYFQDEKIIGKNEISLLGNHNLNNVMAAILVAKTVDVSTQAIRKAIKEFKPLKTRLNIVGEFKGITFVDDSLATIPEATIAAIETFSGKIGSIILGGSDRGQDFRVLARKIGQQKIHTLILFPTTGKRIKEEIQKTIKGESIPKFFEEDNMKNAVKRCFENTPKGKVCLLSCASPSFSIFKDYEDRSKQFRSQIRNYVKGGKK